MSELNKQYFKTKRIHKKGFKKWGWVFWGVIFIVSIYHVYNSVLEQIPVKESFHLATDQFDFTHKFNNGDTLTIIANVSVCATFRVEKDVITKENDKVYIQSEAAGFVVDEWHETLPKIEYQYNVSDTLNFEYLFRYVSKLGTEYNSIYSNTFKIIYRGDTVRYYSNGLGEQVPNSEYYLSIKRRLYPKQKIYEPLEDVPQPPTPPSD